MGGSPPVVDDVQAGPAIASFVRPVHRNALNMCPESSSKQLTISLAPVKVYTGLHAPQTAFSGERFAAVQKTLKQSFRIRRWPDSRKLDVTSVASGFASLTAVADGKSVEGISSP